MKYITFTELMISVESDLDSYADEGMIDRSKYIKTVQTVNADLSLSINPEKEAVLDIKNYRATLPSDFETLDCVFLCEEAKPCPIVTPSVDPSKIVREHDCTIEVDLCDACPDTTCPDGSQANMCGQCFKIYEYQPMDVTIQYSRCLPIKLTKRAKRACSDNCPSKYDDRGTYMLDIDDNIITIDGVKEGKLYMAYCSDMVNGEGELILPNHPLVRRYYETAVIYDIFKNYYWNKDSDVNNQLQLAKQELREARIEAMNFAYMPEFCEIHDYYKGRRANFTRKYVSAFQLP
jgi:hypothetical protein